MTCYSGYNVPGKRGGQMEDLKLHFVCLDRDSGKVLWSKDVQPKLPEQATIREGHGYASGTPVADGERIYVFFGKTGVIAFDYDGKQLWQADVGEKLHGWGSATSPVLAGELVIVNASVESETLVALDRKTGKEVWRASGIKDSWNTPIVVTPDSGMPELVVAIFGKVLGFDPATGKRLWSCDTDIGWYMVPSLVAHDGVVYCIGGRNGGGALAVRAGGRGDVTKTHRLWAIKKGSNVSSPVYHDGHLYWMNDVSATAFCAEAKTGKIVYEEKIEGVDDVYASPVLADGKLYYVTRDWARNRVGGQADLREARGQRPSANGDVQCQPRRRRTGSSSCVRTGSCFASERSESACRWPGTKLPGPASDLSVHFFFNSTALPSAVVVDISLSEIFLIVTVCVRSLPSTSTLNVNVSFSTV